MSHPISFPFMADLLDIFILDFRNTLDKISCYNLVEKIYIHGLDKADWITLYQKNYNMKAKFW